MKLKRKVNHMNAFLISFNNTTSEFVSTFNEVQLFMNNLEKEGIVNNVTVSKFENSILTKSINYNYNGESWVK